MQRRPRTKPRDERRGDLLDAAEQVLVERGMAAFTVDEVAIRAGVAKGTFYLYFQSKEEVLAALRNRFLDVLVSSQEAELAQLPDDDWPGRLELWMESSIRGYLTHVRLHDALFMHAVEPSPGRGPVHPANPHLRSLVEIVREGHETGMFAVESPMAAAVLLYAAMHGVVDYVIDNPGDVTVDEVLGEARRLCRRLANI